METERAVSVVQIQCVRVIVVGKNQVQIAVPIDIAKRYCSAVVVAQNINQLKEAIALIAVHGVGFAIAIGQNPIDIAVVVDIKQRHGVAV